MKKSKEILHKIKTSKLLKIELIVTILELILGTLLHFIYEWSGNNAIIASFSAVNESVWEHLKLVFYPMLILGLIEYYFVKNIANNYIEAKAIGIFTAISFIVISFFTYTGIIGQNFLILDISSFMISVLIGEYIRYQVLKIPKSFELDKLAFIMLFILLIVFIIFTFYPPIIPLFEDPIYGTFGIEPKRID